MEIRFHGHRILLDNGLYQGSRTLEALNRQPFRFDARKISAVVLSHAHIDHSGLLPKLVVDGFSGQIWCTVPTQDLLYQMLPDSGRIRESEAERRNRRPDRADEQKIEPVYTDADALVACAQARPVPLATSRIILQ